MQNRPSKTLTRFAFGAVALGSAVTLAACSSTSSVSAPAGKEAALPKTITVGATLPMTGGGAPYGALMRDGLSLGIQVANQAGGLKGSKLTLKVLDDQAQPGLAVSETRQLISDNAVAIATAYAAPPLAQAPIAARSGVPIFNGGGDDPVQLGIPNLWNDVLMITQEAHVMFGWAHQNLGVKKIGILFETDFTQGVGTDLANLAKSVTGQPGYVQSVSPSATNVTSQIDNILAQKPNAIYLAADGNIATLALQELAQSSVKIPILGYSATLGAPGALNEPTLDLYATSLTSIPSKAFLKAYDQVPSYKTQQPPNLYLMLYYTIAQIIYQGLEKAIAKGMSATGASLEKILETRGMSFTGASGNFSFTADHGASGSASILHVRNGKTVTVTTIPAPAP